MRLFVGIFLPAGVVAHLNQALTAVRTGAGLRRWLPADRWHVTLAFLGAVQPQRVDRIRTIMAPICAAEPALRLRLTGAGSFDTGRGAGVLWIGVQGEGLGELAARIRGAVLTDTDARPFQAHLTIARWRSPERPDESALTRLRAYDGPEWVAARVDLVRSHLGPQPRYERLESWPIAGPDAHTDGG